MVSRFKKYIFDKLIRSNADNAGPSTPRKAPADPVPTSQKCSETKSSSSQSNALQTVYGSKLFGKQSTVSVVSSSHSQSLLLRNSRFALRSSSSDNFSETSIDDRYESSTSTPDKRNSSTATPAIRPFKSRRSSATVQRQGSNSRIRHTNSWPESGTPTPPPRSHRRQLLPDLQYPDELNPFHEDEDEEPIGNLVPTSDDFINKLYSESQSDEITPMDEITQSNYSSVILESRMGSDTNIFSMPEHLLEACPPRIRSKKSMFILKNTTEYEAIGVENSSILENREHLPSDNSVGAVNAQEHKRSIKKKKAPKPPGDTDIVLT